MTDITERFQQACQALPTAHVVKHPQSSYLDIMNALQTFHPRTDTGLDRSSIPLPAYDPSPDLTADEVCAVIDRLSALEMAWYTGSSLCQSIYTCLHYFHPDRLGDSPSPCVSLGLRAYIAATGKCVELAWNEFTKRHVYDMEDVWLDHYGLSTSMTDEVDEILDFCGETMHVLERLAEDTEGLVHRLRVRSAWLDYLHLHSAKQDPREPLRALERLLQYPRPVYEDYPKDGFDDNMPASLRQSMPLLPVDIPSATEAQALSREMVGDLMRLHSIPDSGDALWQAMMRLNLTPRPNALVLSIYKSTVLDKVDPDYLIGDLIERETELPNAVLHLLETGPEQGKSLVVWRDLVRGCAISTLTVPILNRSRQRRDLSALSFTWYERAAFAETLSTDPRFSVLARFCHAQRLDCLLDAALAAWDAQLVIAGEEPQAWWWVEKVTSARLALGMHNTWRTVWVRVWYNVAVAMQALLGVVPLGRGKALSVEEFKLRHKWARKRPTIASGEKVGKGLFPSYSAWKIASLSRTSNDDAVVRAKDSLRAALTAHDQLCEMAPDLGSLPAIEVLKRDISHNATTLEDGAVQWAPGSRNRWIPLLQR